jgi:anti-anti-sigma regulatory factor
VEAGQPETLILDLREVSFFDSTGLQLVPDADVRAREEARAGRAARRAKR